MNSIFKGLDLNDDSFVFLLNIDPVKPDEPSYSVILDKENHEDKVHLTWKITRTHTKDAGNLYVTVFIMNELGDIVWESPRMKFIVVEGISGTEEIEDVPQNILEQYILQSSAFAQAARVEADRAHVEYADLENRMDELEIGTIDPSKLVSGDDDNLLHVGSDNNLYLGLSDLPDEEDPHYLADKPFIATKNELFSGDYKDLENTPKIPEKLSELVNDMEYITSDDLPEINIPTKLSEFSNDVGYITEEDIPEVDETDPLYAADKPNIAFKADLFSGNYNDLSNKPVMPSKISELENDLNLKDGLDGDDGLSAYEIAIKNGFDGSEEEWLESLNGQPGTTEWDGITDKPSEFPPTEHTHPASTIPITPPPGMTAGDVEGAVAEMWAGKVPLRWAFARNESATPTVAPWFEMGTYTYPVLDGQRTIVFNAYSAQGDTRERQGKTGRLKVSTHHYGAASTVSNTSAVWDSVSGFSPNDFVLAWQLLGTVLTVKLYVRIVSQWDSVMLDVVAGEGKHDGNRRLDTYWTLNTKNTVGLAVIPAGYTQVVSTVAATRHPELSKKNILHNADFSVNLLGLTEYSGVGNAFDRWRIASAALKVTKMDGFLRIARNAAGTNPVFTQIVEYPDKYRGKTVTLSLRYRTHTSVTSGSLFRLAIFYGTAEATSYLPLSETWNTHSFPFTIPETATVLEARIQTMAASGIDDYIDVPLRNGIKLELGTLSTLANDPPPDTGDTEEECKRYQLLITQGNYSAVIVSANEIRAHIPTTRAMRINPTLVSGTVAIRAAKSVTNETGFTFSYTARSNGIGVVATKTDHGLSEAWLFLGSALFDANL